MSYEPKILIEYNTLAEHFSLLDEEQYLVNENDAKVAKYLLNSIESEILDFGCIALIICEPEGTTFNRNVREKLDKLDVNYRLAN